MFPKSSYFLLVGCLALAGCGVRPVTGGTKGTLRASGAPLGEVQVTVHQVAGSAIQPVGFGVSSRDGSFALVTNGAAGPLHLAPGEYRCTLESAGAPVKIPQEYTQAETTPLKISWTASDGGLNLEVPIPHIP